MPGPATRPSIRPEVSPTPSTACAAPDLPAPAPPPDDDGGADVGTAPFTLTVAPDSFIVPQGGHIDLDVTVTRAPGFDGDIDVTADGLPAGVSATPLTLAGLETNGSIQLSALRSVGIPAPDHARVRGRVRDATASAPIGLEVRGAPGSVDTSFGNGGSVYIGVNAWAAAEQTDGKVVFTGRSDDGLIVCRVRPDGTPDLTFGTSGGCGGMFSFGGGGTGYAIRVRSGFIYVAGGTYFDGFGVARLLPNGDLDSGFGVNGWAALGSSFGTRTLVLTENRVLVSGGRNGAPKGFLWGLTLDGQPDPSFSNHLFGENSISGLVQLPDCRLVVTNGAELRAYFDDGIVDPSFGENGIATLPISNELLASDASGELLLSGEDMHLQRFSPSGVLEGDYAPLPTVVATYAVETTPDDRMLFVGYAQVPGTDDRPMAVARRLPSGTPDPAFGDGGLSKLSVGGAGLSVTVLRDGRYLVTGTQLVRIWN